MIRGIDISEHNGNVDMEKLKSDGIEFAILRLGYGKNQNQIDKKFKVNYENAIKNNIPVGIYLYSTILLVKNSSAFSIASFITAS